MQRIEVLEDFVEPRLFTQSSVQAVRALADFGRLSLLAPFLFLVQNVVRKDIYLHFALTAATVALGCLNRT